MRILIAVNDDKMRTKCESKRRSDFFGFRRDLLILSVSANSGKF